MSIPKDWIELLLSKIDLVELISTHIPLKKKSSDNYFACCPFHQEKSASFSVSLPKQFYYCFGCGEHGNAIDFLMQYCRLSFLESLEQLAHLAGMSIPQSPETSHSLQTSSLYALNAEAAAFYYKNMRHSERAIQYLKERGIDGHTAQQFQLGYAPSGWAHLFDHFGSQPEKKEHLLQLGLIIKNEGGRIYDRFRDRIIFPIHDYRGRIVGFGGRIIDQGEPKYLNSPDSSLFQKGHELYGLYQALSRQRKLERIIVVEGYMDVIALYKRGIQYAVATLGTATTPHHLKQLLRFTSEIVFCFDGDEAGKKAAWRALQTIFPSMQDHLQIRFLFLADGEDPDSLIQKKGVNAFQNVLENSLSLSDFFFQTILKESDLSTLEGRARFVSLGLTHLKTLPAGLILQNLMTDELAKRGRMARAALKMPAPKPQTEQTAQPEPQISLPPSLRLAIALLLQNPKLIRHVTSSLPQLQIQGLSFFKHLIELIQASPHITTGAIKEHFRGQKEEPLTTKLAHWEHLVPEKGLKEAFLSAVHHLYILEYESVINNLLTKAASEGLSEEEKQILAHYIAKKKSRGQDTLANDTLKLDDKIGRFQKEVL